MGRIHPSHDLKFKTILSLEQGFFIGAHKTSKKNNSDSIGLLRLGYQTCD